jgi:2-keto-myo-inositol isomerase
MIPTLAQICSLPSPLEADVADYAAGHCQSLELWFTKLENYLTKQSITQFKALLAEHNMTVPVVSYQGGLLDTQGDKRRESWDLLLRRLDLCAELEIKTIVIAADTTAPFDQQAFGCHWLCQCFCVTIKIVRATNFRLSWSMPHRKSRGGTLRR